MHIPNTSPYVRILESHVDTIAAEKRLSKIDALEYLLQLLTPCTSALYLTGINVPRIPSLKHLTNLSHLDLSWNQLTELPEMPEGLTWLMCSRNRLTSLQGIPSTVRTLIGDSNKVRVVSGLPAGLNAPAVTVKAADRAFAFKINLPAAFKPGEFPAVKVSATSKPFGQVQVKTRDFPLTLKVVAADDAAQKTSG